MEKRVRRKKHIQKHFWREDPLVHKILADMEWELLEPAEKNSAGFFNRLCREIISQQLGSGAARAIVARFRKLFPRGRATPGRVLTMTEGQLRAVGMSWAKARSLRDLASKIQTQEIRFDRFPDAEDEAIIAQLVKIKGIGRWTAEMFLIFTLGREDVFSSGDLALQKGLRHLYGYRRTRTEKSRGDIIARWRPYRSYASLALWHVMDSQK
ncbi:MAG: DNA-3-methyladenine glycosylase 2 family protein [Candidatus Sungbacteria bacterium]|uniref:DNA-3-methyladenine glycosylase II n=1 Tax=Candidatus Sungiibacteriota bacterium TaxID=2750080 RepID=A0A932QY16_9BACT|nr:DNA-3-methyladenine glycosylase 2 family protein [Candidatus Sungbacteria bacterium]